MVYSDNILMQRLLRHITTTIGVLVSLSFLTSHSTFAAASAGSATPIKPTITHNGSSPMDTEQSGEARALELAQRFFEPLFADAKTDKDRASLLHQRGVLFLRSDCKLRAIADFNQALRIGFADAGERSDLLFHRACAYLLLPTPDAKAAIADLTTTLTARPNDPEALYVRAMAYRQLGKKSQATADLEKAAALVSRSDTGLRSRINEAQSNP